MSDSGSLDLLQAKLLEYFSTQGLAIDYLQMVHGTWVTGGDSTTLATTALMSMNIAAFGLGMVMFYGTILGGIIKTGLEGDPFGKEWSQDYMAVRLISGAMLMAPVFVGGNVSLIQKLIMFTIVSGSNVADGGYKKVVNESLMTHKSDLFSAHYQVLGRNIWQGMHCAAVVSDEKEKAGYPILEFDTGPIDTTLSKMDLARDDQKTGSLYNLFGFFDLKSAEVPLDPSRFSTIYAEKLSSIKNSYGSSSVAAFDNIQFGDDGECGIFDTSMYRLNRLAEDGSVVWGEDTNEYDQNDVERTVKNNIVVYQDTVKEEIYNYIVKRYIPQVFEVVAPLAEESSEKLNRQIEDSTLKYLDSCGSAGAEVVEHACNIIKLEQEFKTEIDSILYRAESSENLNTAITTLRDHMLAQGWIFAGAWTFQITRIGAAQQELVENTTEFTEARPRNPCPDVDEDEQCPVTDKLIVLDDIMEAVSGYLSPNKGSPGEGIPNFANTMDTTNASSWVAGSIISLLHDVGSFSLSPAAEGPSGTSSLTSGVTSSGMSVIENPFKNTAGTDNPIVVLTRLGHGIMNVSHFVDLLLLKAKMAKTQAEAIAGQPFLGWLGFVAGIFEWFIVKLTIWWGLMSGIGFLLAYVLPLLPAIRWLAPAIGWLVQSVVAMAAAPLMVVLLMLPEGQGIMGTRYETLLRYMASNFLRPILDVTAIVCAFTLMYAVFGLFNGIFWLGVDLGYNASIFEVMTAIYIYCYLAYHIIDALMKLPMTMTKEVLTLIGGGVDPFGAELIGSISPAGGLDQAGNQLGNIVQPEGSSGKRR